MMKHDHAWKIALCLCCVALGACVLHADYPSDWTPLETGQRDCSAINGVYANVGVRINSSNKRSTWYLAPLLVQEPGRRGLGADVDNVEISVTKDGILDIAAWPSRPGSQPFVVTKRYSRDKAEYRCEAGTIQLSRDESGSQQGVSGIGSVTTYFARSTDGALVVKESSGGVAFLIFVPMVASLREWYRFERSTATKPASPLQPTR